MLNLSELQNLTDQVRKFDFLDTLYFGLLFLCGVGVLILLYWLMWRREEYFEAIEKFNASKPRWYDYGKLPVFGVSVLVVAIVVLMFSMHGLAREKERLTEQAVVPVSLALRIYEESNSVRVIPMLERDGVFGGEMVEAVGPQRLLEWIAPLVEDPWTTDLPEVTIVDENRDRTTAHVFVNAENNLTIKNQGN